MRVIQKSETDPLDQLAQQAQQIDGDQQDNQAPGEPGATGSETPEDPGLSNAQCVTMAVEIIRDTLCVVAKVKSPKSTLSETVARSIGDAWGPLLDKYGISLNSIVGDLTLELKAAAVTVPAVLAFRFELQQEMNSKAKPINDIPTATVVGDDEVNAGI